MSEQSCQLCGSKRFIVMRTYSSSEIIRQYYRRFDIDVAPFFPAKEFSALRCVECDLIAYSPAISGDVDFYDTIQNFPLYYEADKPEFSFAIEKICEFQPKSILEIGCGAGLFLNKINNAFKVRASEYSRRSIEKLQKANIQLDSPEDAYDFILCFQVLEHVMDVSVFIQHSINKLNQGGFLLITVPNSDSKYLKEVNGILNLPPHHMTQWTKTALENIAKFKCMEIISYYTEQHRIEHYIEIVACRRNKLSFNGVISNMVKKFGYFFDHLMAPYFFDHINYPGATHGILLRKR